jgi:hypothetical protein
VATTAEAERSRREQIEIREAMRALGVAELTYQRWEVNQTHTAIVAQGRTLGSSLRFCNRDRVDDALCSKAAVVETCIPTRVLARTGLACDIRFASSILCSSSSGKCPTPASAFAAGRKRYKRRGC